MLRHTIGVARGDISQSLPTEGDRWSLLQGLLHDWNPTKHANADWSWLARALSLDTEDPVSRPDGSAYCPYCPERPSFPDSERWHTHVRRFHSDETAPVSGLHTGCLCWGCGRFFISRTAIRVHKINCPIWQALYGTRSRAPVNAPRDLESEEGLLHWTSCPATRHLFESDDALRNPQKLIQILQEIKVLLNEESSDPDEE